MMEPIEKYDVWICKKCGNQVTDNILHDVLGHAGYCDNCRQSVLIKPIEVVKLSELQAAMDRIEKKQGWQTWDTWWEIRESLGLNR